MEARVGMVGGSRHDGAGLGSADWCPCEGSGFAELRTSVLIAFAIMAPFFFLSGRSILGLWRQREADRIAAIQSVQAYERLSAAPALPVLPLAEATRGRDVFMTACFACHGAAGTGVQGLGKNLIESDFVASHDDRFMHDFLITGRPFALPVAMPPRGGRPELTDEDLTSLVVYLRGLQDPRRMPALPAFAVTVAPPSESEKAAALSAAGGDAELAGYIASGTKIFGATCIACHGPGGVGIKGNGKALAVNDFIKSQDDEALLAFIKRGRDPSDPKNTTGVAMPPRGGNPALSDDDLLDVISYLRTLQGPVTAARAGNP